MHLHLDNRETWEECFCKWATAADWVIPPGYEILQTRPVGLLQRLNYTKRQFPASGKLRSAGRTNFSPTTNVSLQPTVPCTKTVWLWDPPNSGVLLLTRATTTTLRQVYAGRGGRALNTNLGATCQLTAVPNSAYTGYPRPPEWHTPYWVCVLWESTLGKYCTSFQTVMHM